MLWFYYINLVKLIMLWLSKKYWITHNLGWKSTVYMRLRGPFSERESVTVFHWSRRWNLSVAWAPEKISAAHYHSSTNRGNYCCLMPKPNPAVDASIYIRTNLFRTRVGNAQQQRIPSPLSVVLPPRYTLAHQTSVAALVCQPMAERSSLPSCLLQRTASQERLLISTEHLIRHVTKQWAWLWQRHIVQATCSVVHI